MRSYFPLAAAGIAVILASAVAWFVTPALQSPQARLNQRIDEQIDRAQSMLVAYNPSGNRLTSLVAAQTQPSEEQWQAALQGVSGGEELAGQIQRLDAEFVRLGGKLRQPEIPGSAAEAYDRMKSHLQQNQQLIADALKIVREAVGFTEQSGGETISGSSHPAATRLEAILFYQQGDLQRRLAAIQRALADEARQRTAQRLALWTDVDTKFRSLEQEVTGRRAAARDTQPATASATTPQAEAEPGPTLAQRVADLRTHRQEVEAQIAEVEKKIAQLKPAMQELTEKSGAAKSRADAAQQHMLALEQKGVDASDPDSLKNFTESYNAASQEYRKASRELTVLVRGCGTSPKLSEQEKEILTDPIVKVDADLEKEQRGLTALESDLRAGQALVETRRAVIAQIDQQIEKLTRHETEVKDRLAKFEALRGQFAKQVAAEAGAVIAAAREANTLETEALELVTGDGEQAARRAEQAAEGWIGKARDQNNEHADSPNPRLTMMAGDRFVSGHAKTVGGDLHYLAARIRAQRSGDLQRHALMLQSMQPTGIDASALLPSGTASDEAGAWATRADAARNTAEVDRAEAVKSAEAALKSYQDADNDVKIWVLHANIAAIHYLLADLSGGDEAKKHLADARKEYDLAIRASPDHPEAQHYKRIIEELSQAPK